MAEKEYIEREALMRDARQNKAIGLCIADIVDVQRLVYDQPTADVVEVVRCKDCVFWQDDNGGYPHQECRWGKDETPDAYDYCSYGMRKDGADNE